MNTTAATGKGFDAVSDVLANAPQAMLEEMSKGGGAFGKFARLALEANRKQPGSFTVVSQNQAQNSSAPPPLTAKEEELINLFEKGAAVDPRVMNYGLASLSQKRKAQSELKQPVGVAALGNRQDIAEKLAAMGRYDDDEIAHVAEGEVIVPAPIMKYYPEIKEQIFTLIRNEGLDPNEFVVGDEMVARNPNTGMQEFGFLSKAWKKIKGVVKKALPYIAAAVGIYFLGPFGAGAYGTTAGTTAATAAQVSTTAKIAATAKAAATFAATNPGTAGFIAGTTTGLAKGKNLKDSLKLGIQAGAVTGTLGNVFGTQGLAKFGSTPTVDAVTGQVIQGPTSGGIQSIFSTAPTNLNPTTGRVRQLGGVADNTMFPKPSFFRGPDALNKTTNLAGLGMIGTGLLTDPEEIADEPYEYEPTREGQAFPGLFYDPVTGQYSDTAPEGIRVIQGPIRRVNAGGAVAGPGTGTSDSIPAMLSDGEFVMTAKAVRGMGDGSREKGAAKMYQLMNRLEGKA